MASEDGKLANGTTTRCCSSWGTYDADDVAAAEVLVLSQIWFHIISFLGLRDNLNLLLSILDHVEPQTLAG